MMEISRVFIAVILSCVVLFKNSDCTFSVLRASNINEAAFTERLSSGQTETEYHECSVPERALTICDEVTSNNEYLRLHKYKFVEGKPIEKRKRFHVRQRTKNGMRNQVINLCKCPTEPPIYIQDNVYDNDVTVFVDTTQTPK